MFNDEIQSDHFRPRRLYQRWSWLTALALVCLIGHTSKADEVQTQQKAECLRKSFFARHYDSTKNFFNETKEQGPARIIWRKATPEEQKKITDILPNLRASIETHKVKPVIKTGLKSAKDLATTTLEWPLFPLMPKVRPSGPVAFFVVSAYEWHLAWNYIERKKAREMAVLDNQVRNEIQNDFLYRNIQQDLSNHLIDDDEAIKRARDLNLAYNNYIRAANHRPDTEGVVEFSAFLLSNPQERLLFDSLAPFVQYVPVPSGPLSHKQVQIKLVQIPPPGFALNPSQTSSQDSGTPGPEQLRKALIVSHKKIKELIDLPRWLDKGPTPDEQASYDQLMKNDYEQRLLQQYQRKDGSLSQDRLIYLVSEDASKRADAEIDQIFGVLPQQNETPAQH